MKVIFMGTPDFSVPCLDMLVKEGYKVLLVVTQPDKPKGRGNRLTAPPVKEAALKYGLRILQPVKVRNDEFYNELKCLEPDLIITVAYGRILTQRVLDIPKYGCINVHASLLPCYRGAAPIQWPIINGERVTGVTTMYMDAGVDTGDMLLKKEVKLNDDMTCGELHDLLMPLGAQLLKETLDKLKSGELKRTPQTNENASYAPILEKDTGHIDWSRSACDIHNLVRGLAPIPGAYTYYNETKIKVLKTSHVKDNNTCSIPGTILKAGKDGIEVATGNGSIKIVELQSESGKRMTAAAYLIGHNVDIGQILGKR